MPETVTQSGEQWLKLGLLPGERGLILEVKAHPKVEKFMQGMSGGRIRPLTDFAPGQGRYQWEPLDDTAPLSYYQFDQPIRDAGASYYLNSMGTNIVTEDEKINLSFLSLVGISEGIQFISNKEVYPIDYRRMLKARIGNAFRDFVREYIKPIKITLVMTSQEF